jgi:CMP-N-acetylneuraminic acid synthetase
MNSDESSGLLEGDLLLDDKEAEPLEKIIRIHDQIKKRQEKKDETLNEQEFNRYLQEVGSIFIFKSECCECSES